MSDSSTITYVIDAEGMLISVCSNWEQFAEGNGGRGLKKEEILGRSLWSFIDDQPTRQLYQDILTHVRSGAATELILRCDAPDERRLLQVTLTPLSEGKVEFRARVISRKSRPVQRLLDRSTPRTSSRLMFCSWCDRFHLKSDRWVEVEDAVAKLGLEDAPELPRIKPVVCPACYTKIVDILAEAKTMRLIA